MASLNNIPSVQYFSLVLALVLSSNLIVYPTSSPRGTSISSDTRLATDIAATRRGYVTQIPRELFLLKYFLN
jgi:hypothetical protein